MTLFHALSNTVMHLVLWERNTFVEGSGVEVFAEGFKHEMFLELSCKR